MILAHLSDLTKFGFYQFFDTLTLTLAILTNMMSTFIHYHEHIKNHRIARLNYLVNAYTFASATMTLLANRYDNSSRTRPVKDLLSNIIWRS
jgi:hypothetical protein